MARRAEPGDRHLSDGSPIRGTRDTVAGPVADSTTNTEHPHHVPDWLVQATAGALVQAVAAAVTVYTQLASGLIPIFTLSYWVIIALIEVVGISLARTYIWWPYREMWSDKGRPPGKTLRNVLEEIKGEMQTEANLLAGSRGTESRTPMNARYLLRALDDVEWLCDSLPDVKRAGSRAALWLTVFPLLSVVPGVLTLALPQFVGYAFLLALFSSFVFILEAGVVYDQNRRLPIALWGTVVSTLAEFPTKDGVQERLLDWAKRAGGPIRVFKRKQ